MVITKEKHLRKILHELDLPYEKVEEIISYIFPHIEETRFKSYSEGFKQGEFEMMIELIHDSNEEVRREQLKSIRSDILAIWGDKQD